MTRYALHVGLKTENPTAGYEEIKAITDDYPDAAHNVYVNGDSFIEWGEPVDYEGRSNDRLHAVIEYEANTLFMEIGMALLRVLIMQPDSPVSLMANCAINRHKEHTPFAISLMEDWSVQFGAV